MSYKTYKYKIKKSLLKLGLVSSIITLPAMSVSCLQSPKGRFDSWLETSKEFLKQLDNNLNENNKNDYKPYYKYLKAAFQNTVNQISNVNKTVDSENESLGSKYLDYSAILESRYQGSLEFKKILDSDPSLYNLERFDILEAYRIIYGANERNMSNYNSLYKYVNEELSSRLSNEKDKSTINKNYSFIFQQSKRYITDLVEEFIKKNKEYQNALAQVLKEIDATESDPTKFDQLINQIVDVMKKANNENNMFYIKKITVIKTLFNSTVELSEKFKEIYIYFRNNVLLKWLTIFYQTEEFKDMPEAFAKRLIYNNSSEIKQFISFYNSSYRKVQDFLDQVTSNETLSDEELQKIDLLSNDINSYIIISNTFSEEFQRNFDETITKINQEKHKTI
ncbi:hypothetical protein H9M94_02630 [Mycoplasma sp. Pen4]|uniref:hypothetical protein n=1 Tax=Mycoplasma sp. Pen4 TaxID=640330 RepID=UPI0016544B7E|nr:hypothetical protein [Mycoplasma sp. Pen4]QNM93482.1 hypothetical protein H9M94_02630 [Mycoplasma sp. Pen4]